MAIAAGMMKRMMTCLVDLGSDDLSRVNASVFSHPGFACACMNVYVICWSISSVTGHSRCKLLSKPPGSIDVQWRQVAPLAAFLHPLLCCKDKLASRNTLSISCARQY